MSFARSILLCPLSARKVLSILLVCVASPTLLHAQFVSNNIGVGVAYGLGSLGDLDGDGDLDLIVTGQGGATKFDVWIERRNVSFNC